MRKTEIEKMKENPKFKKLLRYETALLNASENGYAAALRQLEYAWVVDTGREPKAIFINEEHARKVIAKRKLTAILTKFPLNKVFNMKKDTMGSLEHHHFKRGVEDVEDD